MEKKYYLFDSNCTNSHGLTRHSVCDKFFLFSFSFDSRADLRAFFYIKKKFFYLSNGSLRFVAHKIV